MHTIDCENMLAQEMHVSDLGTSSRYVQCSAVHEYRPSATDLRLALVIQQMTNTIVTG